MKIINPIYDQAFKYMMDKEPIAKKVLSIILGQEVIALQSKPQETKTYSVKHEIPLARFDFKAIVRNPQNEEVNVLIEIQKSNKPDPIVRFRRYLGKNYLKQETYIDNQGQEQTAPLPIVTIYFLGYKLKEYDTPAILVNNVVTDTVSGSVLEVKNDFVQLLTHPSYILQIPRLRPQRKTRIEKFLSIFDQDKVSDSKYILNLEEKVGDADIDEVIDYLHLATEDDEMIRKLEFEEDVETEFLKLEDELEKALREKEKALREKEKAQRETAEAQKQNTVLINTLLRAGHTHQEIATMISKTVEEIYELLKQDAS